MNNNTLLIEFKNEIREALLSTELAATTVDDLIDAALV
jgi:hypothetical protein